MDDDEDVTVNGELVLHGIVGDSFMDEGFTAKQVIRALSGMSGDITVRLNSGGGDPFDGEAIRAMLAAHAGKVTVMVEGVAASAASLIAMAADEIVMTRGSIMMIHDPSSITLGTAGEHRAKAEFLEKIAGTFAEVYAARAGMTPEDARALMLAETWMKPAEAVEMGFADRVEDEEMKVAAAFPFEVYARAPEELRAAARERGWKQPINRAAAQMKEAAMAEDKQKAAPETAATEMNAEAPKAEAPKEPRPDLAAMRADAAKAERARISGITEAVMVAGCDKALAEALIDQDVTMEVARERIFAEMAKRTEGAPHRHSPTVRITRDERDTARQGIQMAMESQIGGIKTDDERARPYMSVRTLPGMAAAFMNERVPLDTADAKMRVYMQAMHSTSDFPSLLENVLNKSLMTRYREAQPTYRNIARSVSFADFRPHPMVKMGDFPDLAEVQENGEIKFGTFGEAKETVAVQSYAIGVALSRQMIINDTLGGLQSVIADRGTGIARFEDKTFFALLVSGTSNNGPTLLETSRQVFNTTDGTLAGTPSAIDIANVNLGKAAMRKQTSVDGNYLDIYPSVLLVGPDKELEAAQLLAPIQAQQAGNVNPFSGSLSLQVSPRVLGNDWYLFADPAMAPVFVYGYLDGFEGPRFRIEDPFGTQGTAMTLEHDFGVGAIDYRGGYRNAGA